MTKNERKSIIKALQFLLDDDPDKWENGINELYLLVFGKKWSLPVGKSISVTDLYLRETKRYENRKGRASF